MARTAQLGNGLVKRFGARTHHLVRRTVTHTTVRCSFNSRGTCAAMYAQANPPGDLLVAIGALRNWQASGMRNLGVTLVARRAADLHVWRCRYRVDFLVVATVALD
jgi:hypothetical protein